MALVIINKEDGVYLDMSGINHVSVRRIVLNEQGDTGFGVIAYPGPGAGYNVATYTDEKEALVSFNLVFEKLINSGVRYSGEVTVLELTSHVEEQEKKEPVKLELVPEDFQTGETPQPDEFA